MGQGGGSAFAEGGRLGMDAANSMNRQDVNRGTNAALDRASNAALGRGGRYDEIAEDEYARRTAARERIEGEYWGLYNSIDPREMRGGDGRSSGGGGGRGGGYTQPSLTNPYGTQVDPYEGQVDPYGNLTDPYANLTDPYQHVRGNEGMEGYREFSRTGGWSPEQVAQAQSTSTAAGRGIYSGLSNALRRSAAGSGGSASGLAGLARQGAYGANESNTNAMLGINQSIRSGRLAGLAGLSNLDTELLDRQEAARQGVDVNRMNAADFSNQNRMGSANFGNTNRMGSRTWGNENRMGSTNWENQRINDEVNRSNAYANSRAQAGAAERRERAGYLQDLMGLAGNDLPYRGLSEQAAGNRLGGTAARRE